MLDTQADGAEQPLTIEERLERRPEKNLPKQPRWEKNSKEIWVGTEALAPETISPSWLFLVPVMHRCGTQVVKCLLPTKNLFQPSSQAHSSEIAFLFLAD